MMWGIFLGSLIFVFGLSMLHPMIVEERTLMPTSGFSPVALLVCAVGMTIALVSTARYAVDLMAAFVAVKPSVKRTIYDDLSSEPELAERL